MLEYQQFLDEWNKLPDACIVSDFPLSHDIELTNRCNLRCLTGDTLILKSNFIWERLDCIKEGDSLIGVKKPERYKGHYEFTETKVLKTFPGIIEKIKKLTLKNGIFLEGTSYHEILTKLGRWIPLKNLTENNPPKFIGDPVLFIENKEYMKGYLSGAFASDGTINKYKRKAICKTGYHRKEYLEKCRNDEGQFCNLELKGNKKTINSYSYDARIAVKDQEFLNYVEKCLTVLEIPFLRRSISWAHPSLQEAIRIRSKKGFEKLEKIIKISEDIKKDWARGFLAGFFDGDGSFDGNTLNFHNTYLENLDCIIDCLEILNFNYSYKLNKSKQKQHKFNDHIIKKQRPIYLIRIKGGKKENIRFWNLCQPKIPRKKRITLTVRGTMDIESIEDMGESLVYNLETDCNNYIANGLIVHNCNACPHHGPNRINNRIPQDMNFELYKKIINEGSKKGLRSIKLNFGGEPLLYDRLIDAIYYAKQEGILDVRLNTNASYLKNEIIKEIIESGLDLLIISDYHQITQFENIIELSRQRELLNSRTPRIRVILRENEDPKKWWDVADEIVQDKYYRYDLNENFTPSDFKCPQPWQRFLILADGTVCSCSCGVFIYTKILGNAWNFSLEDLWNGKQMKFLRYCHEFGETHLLKQCRMCPARKEYIKKEGMKND